MASAPFDRTYVKTPLPFREGLGEWPVGRQMRFSRPSYATQAREWRKVPELAQRMARASITPSGEAPIRKGARVPPSQDRCYTCPEKDLRRPFPATEPRRQSREVPLAIDLNTDPAQATISPTMRIVIVPTTIVR